ncbi:MAG TPA: FHA domain-containing protein [Myxococcota bacterium]|nr:FHA domain-containing protein [Myxococcota bacterium]
MRDGRTVKRSGPRGRDDGFEDWHVTLVVVAGPAAGAEHRLAEPRVVLGRGPAVGIELVDDEISLQHAAVEYGDEGFRVVDLGSTNGTRVNGEPVKSQLLEHGDRVEIGRHVVQLVLEKRDSAPRVYVLDET